jgi:putative ATP-grasp target RiPP
MPDTQVTEPWGLTRVDRPHANAPTPYATFRLDPDTQLTRLYDDQGEIVNKEVYQTISLSRPHDGAANAPKSADDSNPDVR